MLIPTNSPHNFSLSVLILNGDCESPYKTHFQSPVFSISSTLVAQKKYDNFSVACQSLMTAANDSGDAGCVSELARNYSSMIDIKQNKDIMSLWRVLFMHRILDGYMNRTCRLAPESIVAIAKVTEAIFNAKSGETAFNKRLNNEISRLRRIINESKAIMGSNQFISLNIKVMGNNVI